MYVSQEVVNQISIIDPTSRTVTGAFATGGAVNAMAFTPDGTTLLAVETLSSAIEIFDQTGTQIGSPIALGANPYAVVVTPDGTTAYVSATFQNKIIEINLTTLTQTNHSAGTLPLGSAVSPDGGHLWVPLMGVGQVQVFALPAFTLETTIPVAGNPSVIVFAPGMDILYVTAQLASTLTGISTVDRSVVSTETIEGGVFAMALCPFATPEPITTTTVAVDPVAPAFTG
jgi:DNA-binding beta-propeller fold protein YncE